MMKIRYGRKGVRPLETKTVEQITIDKSINFCLEDILAIVKIGRKPYHLIDGLKLHYISLNKMHLLKHLDWTVF